MVQGLKSGKVKSVLNFLLSWRQLIYDPAVRSLSHIYFNCHYLQLVDDEVCILRTSANCFIRRRSFSLSPILYPSDPLAEGN